MRTLFHLTKKDKNVLKEFGYTNEDIEQIAKTKFSFEYCPKGNFDYKISQENAIRIIGRKAVLSGIARAAFHFNATRTNKNSTKVVYIESNICD